MKKYFWLNLYPVVSKNLELVAGVWTVFEESWLIESCVLKPRKQYPKTRDFTAVSVNECLAKCIRYCKKKDAKYLLILKASVDEK